jgi:hypothetical protein
MHRTALGAIVLAIACTTAAAQSTPSVEDRLRQLEAETARLRDELARQQPATRPAIPGHEEIDHEDHDDHDTHDHDAFRLDIGVVTDARGSVSSRSDNPARNRFDVALVELDLRARIARFADAVAILPVVREVEDPLFPEPDPEGGVETAIEIEEAYLLLHDFGVPHLTAKLGRFHLRFGRQNLLHSHSLPTVDNNFVNQSFLGPEAISDAGLSLTYAIPLADANRLELTAEIVSGEGGEESPVVNNSTLADTPTLNLHAAWNRNLSRDVNLELGGSALFATRDDESDQHARLFGVDVTLTRKVNDLTQLLQAEAIYGDVETAPGDSQHAFGAYVLGQQQINRTLHAGLRLDWTQNAVDDTQELWGISPYLTWYPAESLRFRVEYQHRQGDVPTEDILYVQATWTLGRHPSH